VPFKLQSASTATSAVPSEVNFAVVGSSLASKRVRSPTKKLRTTTATATVTTATIPPDQSTLKSENSQHRQQHQQQSNRQASLSKAPSSVWGNNHSVDGYELFGHKISPVVIQSSNLNKFTLERTEAQQQQPEDEDEDESDEECDKKDNSASFVSDTMKSPVDSTVLVSNSNFPINSGTATNDNDTDNDSSNLLSLSQFAVEYVDSSDDENLFSELSRVNDPTTLDREQQVDDDNDGSNELRELSYTASDSKLEVLVSGYIS
jgi:hypothetical protein